MKLNDLQKRTGTTLLSTINMMNGEEKQQSPEHREPVPTKRHALCAVRHAISYRELNRRSNHLARVLMEKGVKPDDIVGIMVHPSVEICPKNLMKKM